MDKKQDYLDFIRSQMEYYDQKSIAEKKKFRLYSITALVANALIPVLTTFSSTPSPYKQIIASLSAVAAVFNGLAITFNSGNSWKHYRNNFTDLESVLRAYSSGQGPFEGMTEEEAFPLFYNRCEQVLSNDRENWYMVKNREKQ